MLSGEPIHQREASSGLMGGEHVQQQKASSGWVLTAEHLYQQQARWRLLCGVRIFSAQPSAQTSLHAQS